MNSSYYHVLLASTYGSGSYDSSTYDGSGTTTMTTGDSGSTGATGSNGGSLSNTGIAVVGIVSLAAAILLAAMIVRVWKRPSKRAAQNDPQE